MELTCIVCPNGCSLELGNSGEVIGAGCKRGIEFAKEEMTCPKRTVCSTVATKFPDFPVLPVRTAGTIPKERIWELMEVIREICVDRRVARGEVILSDVLGTGVDLIATSDMRL